MLDGKKDDMEGLLDRLTNKFRGNAAQFMNEIVMTSIGDIEPGDNGPGDTKDGS